MTAAVQRLRRTAPNATAALESVGGFVELSLSVAARLGRRAPGRGALGRQLEAIGIRSLSVATLTAVFSCMRQPIEQGAFLKIRMLTVLSGQDPGGVRDLSAEATRADG